MRDLNVRTNLIAVGDKPAKLAKLTVTDNGTYTPTYPIEGYDEVKVEIPEPPPVILEDLNVTENGTYDPADYMADGFNIVKVEVPEAELDDFYTNHNGINLNEDNVIDLNDLVDKTIIYNDNDNNDFKAHIIFKSLKIIKLKQIHLLY